MKKLISSILFILIISAMLPITALASEGMTAQEYLVYIQKFTDEEIDRILDPTQYATLDEFNEGTQELHNAWIGAGVRVNYSNVAESNAVQAASTELFLRAVDKYQATRAVVEANEIARQQLPHLDTASSWAQEAILDNGRISHMSLRAILDLDLDYQSEITRIEFIDMLITWAGTVAGHNNINVARPYGAHLEDEFIHDLIISRNPNYNLNDIAYMLPNFDAPNPADRVPNPDNPIYRVHRTVTSVGQAMYLGLTDGSNLFGTLTREQAATLIMRTVNLVNMANSDRPLQLQREDIDDAEILARLREAPHLRDLPDHELSMLVLNEKVGIQQRHFEETKQMIQAPINAPDAGFDDNISSWAVDGVNFCRANRIMNGVGNNRFNPRGTFTVEQAIVALSRVVV